MWQRVYALFVARNTEFFRDRSALAWSVLMPVLIIIGFSYAFTEENPAKFKVALYANEVSNTAAENFQATRYVQFIDADSLPTYQQRVQRHQVDLLLDVSSGNYWINQTSPNSYIVEKLLIAAYSGQAASLRQNLLDGEQVRYVDWVIPGVLAMNIMWGALWGIGYVIVRYRKMGVLKRLRATPVTALEFLTAQILSRLWLLLVVNLVIYIGLDFFVDFRMNGSYLLLLLVFAVGCINLICCGLVVAARISNEELAGGLLNLFSWPMMFLSGVWFSLEGAHPGLKLFSQFLPLTHVTDAAREIMIDGSGLLGIADHLLILGLTSIILLIIGARVFRWE